MNLAGRHVLITGAARGVGGVIARHLAACGATLTLADILTDEGNALADELGCEFLPVDLRSPESIEAMAATVKKPLHGLVNNGAIATGIGGVGYADIPLAQWDKVMEVNIRGTWLMIRACAPMLEQSGSGRIVNLASDTALWGAPNLLGYVASKGAVIAMTRSLARELGADGIGVVAVAPGILTTASTEYVPPHRHALYEENRAIPGKQPPEDMGGVIAFLLTEDALPLTGQLLPVNRGFVFT